MLHFLYMKKHYTEEQIVINIKKLAEALGHEPTAYEIDDCEYLPPCRTIQRRFGGLPAIRKKAGFKVLNHTTGKTRGRTANMANNRSKSYERKIHDALVKKYHDPLNGVRVTRQFAWQQWKPQEVGGYYSNTLCDTAVSKENPNHVDIIDFFYAQNIHSLGGCFRDKKRKYVKNPVYLLDGATHTIYFVCVNKDISQDDIEGVSIQKQGIRVLSLASFLNQHGIDDPTC